MIIKLKGIETTSNTTPSTYNGYRYIRFFNNTAGNVLITQTDGSNNTLGTVTLGANTTVVLAKASMDTFQSNSSILAVAIGDAG